MKSIVQFTGKFSDVMSIVPSPLGGFALLNSEGAEIAASPYPDDLSRWAFNHGAIRVVRNYDLNLEPK